MLRDKPPAQPKTKPHPTFALVGNPNAGKTTLFNNLTGLRQKVANYSGVTIEKKIGTCFSQHGQKLKVIDLPGSYSLSAQSPDEAILQKALMGRVPETSVPDCMICVVDASNLERNLFLAVQVAELGLPVILVLNMMDTADKAGLFIDTGRIEKELGVTVIPCQAHKKEGLVPLKIAMSRASITRPNSHLALPPKVMESVLSIQSHLVKDTTGDITIARGKALILLTEGTDPQFDSPEVVQAVVKAQSSLDENLPDWRSQIINTRYQRVEKLYKDAVHQKSEPTKAVSEYLDSFFLHKFWGWVGLFLVMGTLFWSIFSFSKIPMDAIDWSFGQIQSFIGSLMLEGPLKHLIIDGVISGVGSVFIFLPQIFMLFFMIGILETSGYLPRAAFILDRFMNRVGLSGKAFIPLLTSFACAIPGVMATRTMSSRAERFATIMVAPWMSCSARLPVYLLMIASFIPKEAASSWTKAGILLIVYTLGALGAFAVAWLFRKTIFKDKGSSSLLELPKYKAPSIKSALYETKKSCVMFLKRAGTVILAFSVILWFLMYYPHGMSVGKESPLTSAALETSFIGQFGQFIEPLLQPLGYDWKIGIGILVSFAARELFVSTMAIIYNLQIGLDANAASLVDTLQGQITFSPLVWRQPYGILHFCDAMCQYTGYSAS